MPNESKIFQKSQPIYVLGFNENGPTPPPTATDSKYEDGMTEKESDLSSCSEDEEDIHSAEEQQKFSNEDSNPSKPNESMTEAAVFNKGGGSMNFINPQIYVAGGDIVSTASKASAGAIPKTTPRNASQSVGERDDGCVQISDDFYMYNEKPLREGTRIYKGYQMHATGRSPVAMKMVVPSNEKAIREVDHLLRLAAHPNVVQIIHSKQVQGNVKELYIIMELCSSQNLQDHLKENREKNTPFNLKKTLDYSKQLVDGIRHIHRNQIVHGDLKPENVLFSKDKDQIKITDFGISKALPHFQTSMLNTSQGTDGYRAPETINSNRISWASDVYSLGLTLHSLCTDGKHPFGEDSDLLNYRIKKNENRSFSGLPDEMGIEAKVKLIDLLDKMLEFDPKKRPTIEEISKHPFFSKDTLAEASSPSLAQQQLAETSSEHPKTLKNSETSKKATDYATEPNSPKQATDQSNRYGAGSSKTENGGMTSARQTQLCRTETLQKLRHPSAAAELNIWKVHAKYNKSEKCNQIVNDLKKGCRIYSPIQSGDKETSSHPIHVTINREEKSIFDLEDVRLPTHAGPTHFLSSLWPGIVVWFDSDKSQLFAINFGKAKLRFRAPYSSEFSLSPETGERFVVLSVKRFAKWIEMKNLHITDQEGVEIRPKIKGMIIKISPDLDEVRRLACQRSTPMR